VSKQRTVNVLSPFFLLSDVLAFFFGVCSPLRERVKDSVHPQEPTVSVFHPPLLECLIVDHVSVRSSMLSSYSFFAPLLSLFPPGIHSAVLG